MATRVVLARRCGLPLEALDALHEPGIVAQARRLEAAREDLEALRVVVEDVLHDLVGGCEDRDRRRALLAARRNIHRGVVADRHVELLRRIGRDRPEVSRWLDAAQEVARAAATETEDRRRLAAAAARAASALRDPQLTRGIAFASTAFARDLRCAPSTGLDAETRLARTAVSYLVRAALKPSPFSTLTTVHPATADPVVPGDADTPAAWARDVTTFRPLAVELHRRCVTKPFAWSGPHPVRAVPAATMQLRDAAYAFLPSYAQKAGLYYRTDEITEVTGETPPVTPARGVESGRLHAPRPWDLSDGHELTALHADGRRRAWPDPVVGVLDRAARAVEDVEAAATPEDVLDALDGLGAVAQEALTQVGSRAGAWLLKEPLVHEIVAGEPVPGPGGGLGPAAEQVLAGRVVPMSFYENLRQVAEAVHGFEPAPLIDFCAEVTIAAERAQLRTVSGADLADLPRGHLSLARPASVVYHQQAGDLIVVNTVMADYLGSRSRWGRLGPLRDAVVRDAVTTAALRHPGTVPYQFSASTDWTTTQRPGPGLPLAEWGGALLDHPGAVDLARFTVRLDRDSRTLQVADPDGAPAALLYGGAIPPHLLKGVEGVLAMICSPWAVIPPRTRPAPTDGGTVAARLERDGIVWSRRTWALAPEAVPVWERGASVTEFVARVDAWRRGHGMPEQLFVAAATASGARRVGKPTWVSLEHPLTLVTALRRPPDLAQWVVTEALPAVSGPGRVVEYVSVVDHG